MSRFTSFKWKRLKRWWKQRRWNHQLNSLWWRFWWLCAVDYSSYIISSWEARRVESVKVKVSFSHKFLHESFSSKSISQETFFIFNTFELFILTFSFSKFIKKPQTLEKEKIKVTSKQKEVSQEVSLTKSKLLFVTQKRSTWSKVLRGGNILSFNWAKNFLIKGKNWNKVFALCETSVKEKWILNYKPLSLLNLFACLQGEILGKSNKINLFFQRTHL